jgi:hypothetical protein
LFNHTKKIQHYQELDDTTIMNNNMKLTPELLLQKAPFILEEVDEAPIFHEEKPRQFPTFARSGKNMIS